MGRLVVRCAAPCTRAARYAYFNELLAKVSDFYDKVFDWKINPIPKMDYRLVKTGGQGGFNGGIFKLLREGR